MTEALIKGIITAGVYSPGKVFVNDIRAGRLVRKSVNMTPRLTNEFRAEGLYFEQ